MSDRRSLLNRNSFLQRLTGAVAEADRTAEKVLGDGIDRWESEGRLEASQAAALRTQISSGEAKDALHHLGVHMLLSAPIPIPGLRNLARLVWTMFFAVRVQVKRLRHRTGGSDARLSNIHSPLVMALSPFPIIGIFAYLAAPPLRSKLMLRLVMDQTARTLPFGCYKHLRLSNVLPPAFASR